ncbi:hypothetical protein [Fulvimonas yonginensis]|uniref:Uncharacterized protein n=1 Tax=Fulvimonas yonginensis TaxID=1495200 RepID=A0ABU8JE10_9GAMM
MNITTSSLAAVGLVLAGAHGFAQTAPPATGAIGSMDHPPATQANGMRSAHPAASSTGGSQVGHSGSPRMKSRQAAHGRGPATSPEHAPDAQHSNGNHLNSGTTAEPAGGSSSGH